MTNKTIKIKTKDTTAAKTPGGLNLQQEKFCQLYVNQDRELFGNGTQCYLAVYGVEYQKKHRKPMKYDLARVLASTLLTKTNVITRINELLETGGFNDENVDKQHLFLINQHADLKTKMLAIKEYNALKKRVDAKIKVDGNFTITGMRIVDDNGADVQEQEPETD